MLQQYQRNENVIILITSLVTKESELVKNINHISIFAWNDNQILPDIVAHPVAFARLPSGPGTQR
jgi:hypothetical protein